MSEPTPEQLRHAGIHWPENANGEHPSREYIMTMPGTKGAVLICAPSARYHYDFIRQQAPDACVVWRAIPRQGKLPADLHWEGARVADECLNLFNEQPHAGSEWFQPLNELQFEKESGQEFPGFGEMAENLRRLRPQLRRKFTQQYPEAEVKILFPPWVPGEDLDHLEDWAGEAEAWDGICLHAYGSASEMLNRYNEYRQRFPKSPIFVGEWNANHTGANEQVALEIWAEVAQQDPLFLGATYYIWETNNLGEQDLSIWNNPERFSLFYQPPTKAEPNGEPTPDQPDAPDPPSPEVDPVPNLSPYPKGVDVASYQGNPDWQIAHDVGGLSFAIEKATEGVDYVNPTFARNWYSIKDNGLYRAAYHFARPWNTSARAEAEFFFGTVEGQGLEPGDILALDFEPDGGGDFGPWCVEFLQRVEELAGCKPIFYTAKGYIDAFNLASYPVLGEYGLWLASWGRSTMPPAPAPWQFVAFWQYSSTESVPGIPGEVDADYFNGPEQNISLYGIPGLAPTPPVEGPPAPPPVSPELESLRMRVERLESVLGYLQGPENSILAALRKESATLHGYLDASQASLKALDAALETLENTKP